MAVIKVNLEEWPRKEVFEFFSGVSNPFYMVSFRQDVTPLYNYVKRKGLSFYWSLCYLVTKAINHVDAFRYVIRDGEVYRIDIRDPSCTDLKPGAEIFHIVTLPAAGAIKEFCMQARRVSASQTQFIDPSKESDTLIYLSCLPWLDITAITNERDLSSPASCDESIPHISWGRYTDNNGRKELGMSIEVNHRLIDGFHIGQFAQELTRLIDALESLD